MVTNVKTLIEKPLNKSFLSFLLFNYKNMRLMSFSYRLRFELFITHTVLHYKY